MSYSNVNKMRVNKTKKERTRTSVMKSSVMTNPGTQPVPSSVTMTNNNESVEKVTYCKTNNRELKIRDYDKDLQSEIQQARESRVTNKLDNVSVMKEEIIQKGYKIKNMIGSGSYAHVFRAKDINNRRDVALKLIELDKCSKNYRDQYLRSEIHVIRELQHENIVLFFHAFNVTQAYVMVMEFVENGTFADHLYQIGAFPEVFAHKLFSGTSLGLEYMHNKSIAHRDLKLENLLLTLDLTPKISDFSLSIIWDQKTLATSWCGTPPYFAPEIFQKKPYNPLAYDIWSLGVCLYVVVNDTIPFMSTDDQQILKKQLNREWKFRTKYEPQLSNNLKTLIRQMLEPDVNQRITIQEVVNSKWLTTEPSSIKSSKHNVCKAAM